MKKILLTAFLVLSAGAIFAQEGVKVGFRATPMVSWATIVDDSTKTVPLGFDTGARLGFSFDFVFTYGFSDNFSFWSGVNIAKKGLTQNFNQSTTLLGITSTLTGEIKNSFTAVEVPIGFKFRSPEIGDGFYIVGFFGATNELNVQNKTDSLYTFTLSSSLGTTTSTTDKQVKDSKDYNFYTLSFTPGVGVDWEKDFGTVEAVVTYHWGLLNFLDKKNTDQIGKLNAIALSLGYYF
jgi:hypothetical protein